jgi:hypothetical protein
VTGADASLVGTGFGPTITLAPDGLAAPGTLSHSASVAIVTIEN